jgi:capsule polysaccharide export protein KpsE/RkpR
MPQESKTSRKNYFTLFDYFLVLKKHRTAIISITAGFLLLSIILYFFVIPPLFLSSATVKTTSKTSGLAGMLASSGISGLGDVSDLAGGATGSTELALYENILSSRRCIEETINKFGLFERYNEKYMQEAVKHFRDEQLEIIKDKVAGTMVIGVYEKDPQLAKDITEFLITQLNKINTELSVQNARNNREFIEQRYIQAKADLKQSEDSLKQYQNVFGIAPDVTTKAAVQSQIQIEGEIKSEEVKLDLLQKILSPDQTEIQMQQEKIKALKKKLEEINSSDNQNEFLKLKGSPDIVMNYLRLTRNVEIQNKILTFILPVYEQAKIDEKKETPTVLILDQPFVPEKKTKPKRLPMVILFTAVGFILSFGGFFVYDKGKEYLSRINDEV